MITMSERSSFLLLNQQLVPVEEALIPAVSSGLYYGAGCFETMVSHDGEILWLEEYFHRFFRGIDYLTHGKGTLPERDNLHQLLLQLIQLNGLQKGRARVRLQYSCLERGGYKLEEESDYLILGEAVRLTSDSQPVRLTITPVTTVASTSRPSDLKLSNMLHYREAFRTAEKMNFDDGILLSESGFVAETAIANLFWMRNRELFTPSESCHILPGITRNRIMKCASNSFSINEVESSKKELFEADAVWVTNSVKGVHPVGQIDSVHFNTDVEVTQILNSYLAE